MYGIQGLDTFSNFSSAFVKFLRKDVVEGVGKRTIQTGQLSARHLRRLSQEDYETLYQVYTKKIRPSLTEACKREIEDICENHSVNMINEDDIPSKINKYIKKIASIVLDTFLKNHIPLQQIDVLFYQTLIKHPFNLSTSEMVGEGKENLHKQTTLLKAGLIQPQTKDRQSVRLRQKKTNMKIEKQQKIASLKQHVLDHFTLLEMIQFLAIIGKIQNKPINKIDWEDEAVYSTFVQFRENSKEEKEKRANAQKLFDELMESEKPQAESKAKSKAKSKRSKKKSKSKRKTSPSSSSSLDLPTKPMEISPSPKASEVQKLNQFSKLNYTLHSRIIRWDNMNLEEVKALGASYATCSNKRLIFLKNSHRLAGIERILDHNNFRNNYSFYYKYAGRDGTRSQTGRGLYTEMIHKGKKYEGIVYVGIGEDDVIYHAMFEMPSQGKKTLESLCKPLSLVEKEGNEGEWEMTTECAFGLRPEDEAIAMEKKDVTYYFLPLINT